MRRRLLLAALCGVLAGGARAADAPAPAGIRVYDFVARLDDKPIGHHRFTVMTHGDGSRRVVSDADFAVRVLGLVVYRYHHHAEEQWQGDCLAGLRASTDDDGKSTNVQVAREGESTIVRTDRATTRVPGCLMTYAYWHPALRTQSRLLNPQTGQVDTVGVQRVAGATLAVDGRDGAASDWRISGGESPVDVWLTEQGDWVGLDAAVAKGRHHLSYRLR